MRCKASSEQKKGPSTPSRLYDPYAASKPEDNPDFDDLILDEELYKELGMSMDEIEQQKGATEASEVDPEGFNLDFDDASSVSEELPLDVRLRLLDKQVYGPEAAVFAGFRPEEVAMARAILDSAGGNEIKVLMCTDEMLVGSVEAALWEEEVDWSQPRPQMWNQGRAWGSQKTLMFSGLSIKAQATILELLEGSGLSGVVPLMAMEEEVDRRLGDVLADAVKEYRMRPSITPSDQLWKEFQSRVMKEGREQELGDLNTLLGDKVRERMRAVQQTEAGTGMKLEEVEGVDGDNQQQQQGEEAGISEELLDEELDRILLHWDQDEEEGQLLGEEGDFLEEESERVHGSVPKASSGAPTDDGREIVQAESRLLVPGSDVKVEAESPPGGRVDEEPTMVSPHSPEGRIISHVFQSQGTASATKQGNPQQPSFTSSSSDSLPLGAPAAAAAAVSSPVGGPRPSEDLQSEPSSSAISQSQSAPPHGDENALGDEGLDDMLLDGLFENPLDELLPTETPLSSAEQDSSSSGSSSRGITDDTRSGVGLSGLPGLNFSADFSYSGGSGSGSVLSQIQEALKAGVPPDQLKQMIDQAYIKMQATSSVPSPTMATASSTFSPTSASRSLSEDRKAPSPPARPAGPARPPPPKPVDDPMLALKPEVRRALEGKNVQFLDMNRLPKKYRDRVVGQMKSHQQQLLEEKEDLLEQQKMQQELERVEVERQARLKAAYDQLELRRNLDLQMKLRGASRQEQLLWRQGQETGEMLADEYVVTEVGEEASSDGHERVGSIHQGLSAEERVWHNAEEGGSDLRFQDAEDEGVADDSSDYVVPPGWELPGSQDASRDVGSSSTSQPVKAISMEEAERDAEEMEEDGSNRVMMDASMIRQLADAAVATGLNPQRALAEAMAVGVIIPSSEAAAAGVRLPSLALIKQAARQQEQQQSEQSEGLEEEEEEVEETQEAPKGTASKVDSSRVSPLAESTLRNSSRATSQHRTQDLAGAVETVQEPSAKRAWGSGLARAAAASRGGAGRVRTSSEDTDTDARAKNNSPPRGSLKSMDERLQSAGGKQVELLKAVGGQNEEQSTQRGGLMTLSQLRDVAKRKGLDFEMLLESARAKGLDIRD
ncbi:hypothetical protein CEUSTIGMA_g4724.t1 [Chlamydomonas eustigma]|uniref:Uncharacterized protein n=1 Tax=Chlamydomonas eustigma TaxID=1157962 RepID=A0A250X2I9_9CHLO|nr:hypothetical protein CEUSTIGMA_g4724.t1 [Chlamydomonas eustigma]|eukprot:GAX77278.1 hypothetical protein CEUSTIGMA_g4724.t1 [Chlamydomonas eustigma]